MADVNLLAPIIIKWESRQFVNNPVDPGGATKNGITLDTWRHVGYDKDKDGDIDVDDVKLINDDDFALVLKKNFWDKYWNADQIKNQSIANILVDWVWGSGSWGVRIPQRLLRLNEDGVAGPKTLAAVNAQDPAIFHDRLRVARLKYINDVVAHSIDVYTKEQLSKGKPSPTDGELMKQTAWMFKQGWINRLNDFKFAA